MVMNPMAEYVKNHQLNKQKYEHLYSGRQNHILCFKKSDALICIYIDKYYTFANIPIASMYGIFTGMGYTWSPPTPAKY